MSESLIERFRSNPVLKPDPHIHWRSRNVFNCGVVKDGDGLLKMLFRASHTEDQAFSDCGLAISLDGYDWYTLDKPVLRCGFNRYCSRGIEDPRIVKWIDDWYYVFATACSEVGGRIGIWKTRNFLDYMWIGIPFDWEDKDACIISEPINNCVYLLHRRAPDIWLSETEDFSLKGGWGNSFKLLSANAWTDPIGGKPSIKIGLAGQPIKTPGGWLVIVHVVFERGNRAVYTLSFIVLDLNNPRYIKYIHPSLILSPTEPYEMIGSVPMVCFSNAIIDATEDYLYIYWGCADTVICGGRIIKKKLSMCYE